MLHDARRLPHLLHSHQITVIAIAVLADRDVEFKIAVALVSLRFAQILSRPGSPDHDTRKAIAPGIRQSDHGDADITLLENAIVGE